VIAAQGQQSRFRQADTPVAQLRHGCRHLLQRNGIVDRNERDVTAIDNAQPRFVRIDARTRIPTSCTGLAGRRDADGAGAEPRAGPVGHGRVEGGADNANVK